MIYTRVSDGTVVTDAEACGPGGNVRAGYRAQIGPGDRISFDMALADAAPGSSRMMFRDGGTTVADAMFTDAERTFADSAEGQAFVARQQMVFDTNQRWKPSQDRQQLSPAALAHAVRGEVARRSQASAQQSQYVADAAIAKAASATARAIMIENMRNAWKA